MKFLNYTLTDWTACGNDREGFYNFYRKIVYCDYWSYIGFMIDSAEFFKSDPNKCFWIFDVNSLLDTRNLQFFMRKFLPKIRDIEYHELTEYKTRVDELLIKYSKLNIYV